MSVPCEIGRCEVQDTLILDGEVVYVEPREVMVNLDSMDRAMRNDFRKPRKPWIWSTSWATGVTIEQHRISGSTPTGLLPLNVFLDDVRQWTVRPSVEAEIALHLNSWLSVASGIGVRQSRFTWSVFDADKLYPNEDRFRFENRNGELWQYVRIPIGIGFEVDTFRVDLTRAFVATTTCIIPLGIRAQLPIKGPLQIEGEGGLRFGIPLGVNRSEFSDGCLVKSDGGFERIALSSSSFRVPGVMPFGRLILSRVLAAKWTARLQADVALKSFSYLDESAWQVNTHSYFLGIGLRYSPGAK